MSLFNNKKWTAHIKRSTLSYSRSFDSGNAVKITGEAINRKAPTVSRERYSVEYEVPASNWTDVMPSRAHGSIIEGEYEVSPSGWPDANLARTYSTESSTEYEVTGSATTAYDQSYITHGMEEHRERVYSVDSQPAENNRTDMGLSVHSSFYKDGSNHQQSDNGHLVNEAVKKLEDSNKTPQPNMIEESIVADDIRNIIMGNTLSMNKSTPPHHTPLNTTPHIHPAELEESRFPMAPESLHEKMQNEHAIFDRIAQSMKYANAYDLGSIALEKRFDAFDDAEDNKTAAAMSHKRKMSQQNPNSLSADNAHNSVIAMEQDFIEDLDLITHSSIQSDSDEIPLDPGIGGRSVDDKALEPGDIILSTTTEGISSLIRGATGSKISHAAIYIGNGKLVEAVDSAVVLRSLDTALNDDSLAVAYRHRDMTPDKAESVVNYLKQQAVAGRKFDNWGLVRAAPGQLARAVCNRLDGNLRKDCLAGANRLKVGTDDKNSFYCSELVLTALGTADLGITDINPSWSSPEQIVSLHLNGLLDYVGHLKV